MLYILISYFKYCVIAGLELGYNLWNFTLRELESFFNLTVQFHIVQQTEAVQ